MYTSLTLTKLGHSCVRLARTSGDGEKSLVIDPGNFSDLDSAYGRTPDAVLITHRHPDHVDPLPLARFHEDHPQVPVFAPGGVVEELTAHDDEAVRAVAGHVTVVQAGEMFVAAGFRVRTFGGQHALIHPRVPVVDNLGYLVDDVLFHPGDSLEIPPFPVHTLLLPIHAPWSRVGEVLDFLAAVRPRAAHQIHDGLLNERGLGLVNGHLSRLADDFGMRYEFVAEGETVEVGGQ